MNICSKHIRLTLLGLAALLFTSCYSFDATRTPPPSKIVSPTKVGKPNITPTEEQVRIVEAKVHNMERQVQDAGKRLANAESAARNIETAVAKAYDKGMLAGSEQAVELRGFVIDLQAELVETRTAGKMVMVTLEETREELVATEIANGELRTQIEASHAENLLLRGKLEEANQKIQTAIEIAEQRDRAYDRVATLDVKIAALKKYRLAVFGLGLVIILFIAYKLFSPRRIF